MKLLTSIPTSRHNRYLHNDQNNIYLIDWNLVQHNMSANSKINEYSENKATYINI